MGTMSPDAYTRSLAYALTCHKRERAMRTVPYTIPYGSILTGTEFREALAKKAQDLKTKRALKSANKKLHPSQDVPRTKSRILRRDVFVFKQILIFCFVFIFV